MSQDGKYRIGYIKISNEESIPEDEPVFVLRGRDKFAVLLLHHYRDLCVEGDCTDYQIVGVEQVIERFQRFKLQHPERMKEPGITKGL